MRPGKLLIIPSIFFFSGFSFATTQPGDAANLLI